MSEIKRRIELTPHESLMLISQDAPPGVAIVGNVPLPVEILELSPGTTLAIRCARCQQTCTTMPAPDRNPIASGWIRKERCRRCGSTWTLVFRESGAAVKLSCRPEENSQ